MTRSGGLPLERIRTMHELVAASSARTEFYMMLLTLFAAIALLLAAVFGTRENLPGFARQK